MKRLIMLVVLMVISTFMLVGCGGGGGGSSSTPTPTGTAVSMATFKGLFYGSATPGTQISFPLSGSDSLGNSWTGSFAIVSDGPTTFESQNVTKSRVLVTLQIGAGAPVSGITSYYYLTSNSTLYKSVSSFGTIYVPTTQTVIPDTIHVGDFDNFENTTNSDGTTDSTIWRLEADYNGNTKFTLSTIERTGATITYTEEDTLYLDPSGNPYRLEVKLTESGITLTMSGNRT